MASGTDNSADKGGKDMDDDDKKPKKIVIHIDQKKYKLEEKNVTGAELRALPDPDIAPDFDLYREVSGGGEDELVENDEVVKLKDGMHFFSAPSTINPGGA